ncbi:MAG: hypothetical protein NVSMB62_23520 [Acidobacteriaceae bacterium]
MRKVTQLLIVDDDPEIRSLLSSILSVSGYATRAADNGFSALAAMRESMPEIIVSDLNMPEMSGFELLSIIRRRFPQLRVVAMSSAFSSGSIPTGVAADAFYEKATGVAQLLASITKVQDDELPAEEIRDASSPMWVPIPSGRAAHNSYILLSCPECLRIFPKLLSNSSFVIHKVRCVFCASAVHYALVEEAALPDAPAARSPSGYGTALVDLP